ncbi:FAD/NAD(P)-binding protein [Leptolyngbya sp. FACHB-261]|uniref:FAD/NAD(P)-binding protein n=1 Tax=Leptolyngbya sp. FACHB-261 TaxID=2692806 RepID=UPI001681F364|nr:FAD/NAD(P)-binding protein [Leptolyngbya sp. FACHB-261]MBD2100075.1 FAD/NAD(P)-binding protein [Leptolyngbya sp. FACHB-261]
MLKDTPTTIAIIGGGFSGCMVAAHLLHRATRPLNIKLIERQTQLGRGVAYKTRCSAHLLNVPAGKISAFPDHPDHFLNWLQRLQKEGCTDELNPGWSAGPEAFVPRKLYGDYIEEILGEAEASASNHVQLERLTNEAIAIHPTTVKGPSAAMGGATLYLRNNQTLQVDKIVLALGNFPPSDPRVGDPSFYKSRRYRRSAWSADALTGLNSTEPVLLIGSGLTAIDLAISLKEQGHQGLIQVVSRHGLLPQSHRPTEPYPSFLDATFPYTISALMQKVRQEVRGAAMQGHDWRAVIDTLRPLTQELWQSLSQVERRRFLRHLRPYWEVHRHRIAPQVAKQINDLLRSGQLVFHAGRIQSYQEDCERVEVVLHKRHTREQIRLWASRVINCTGPECDYRKFHHPLITSLCQQGLLRSDALGLGLDVATNGALIDANGNASRLLFTLGPLRKGNLWETTAVPELRIQAFALAQELLRHQSLQKSESVLVRQMGG